MLQNSQAGSFAAEDGVVKGFTPAQNITEYSPPLPPPPTQILMMFVCLLAKFAYIQELYYFLYELTDLSQCISLKAIGKDSYETAPQGGSFPLLSFQSERKNVNKTG